MVFSILTSPIVLFPWLFNFLRSSLFAGITSLRVVLRSGSEAEEYVLVGIEIHDFAVSWILRH